MKLHLTYETSEILKIIKTPDKIFIIKKLSSNLHQIIIECILYLQFFFFFKENNDYAFLQSSFLLSF